MENCLVTKLKNVVNNDNLCELDEIKIQVNLSSSFNKGVFLNVNPGTNIILNCTNDTVLKIDGNIIDTPYTLYNTSYQYGKLVMPEKSNSESAILSIKKKYLISYLGLTSCDVIGGIDLDNIKYYTNLNDLYIYNSWISGSMLELANATWIKSFCFDLPSKEFKDGDIKSFLTKRASLGNMPSEGYIRISGRPNASNPNYIKNYPVAMNGTYRGIWCKVFFTSNTTTCPGGWYIQAPNDGTYYNSLDQEITPPNV